MTVIFDGKALANQLEQKLAKKVKNLPQKPCLAIILLGNDKASELYVVLKQKAASRIGIKTKLYRLPTTTSPNKIKKIVNSLNADDEANGILLQLPLPTGLKKYQNEIIQSIKPEKDVDGLREDSPFTPATIKAVFLTMQKAQVKKSHKILIIGARGEVGHRLLKELQAKGYPTTGIDKKSPVILSSAEESLAHASKDADIIISSTGSPNSIKADMIKQDVIAIDIGSPKGDFDKSVYEKASFITPVPGGIGPLTIISLLDNLLLAVSSF